jgi:hypothetical protein
VVLKGSNTEGHNHWHTERLQDKNKRVISSEAAMEEFSTTWNLITICVPTLFAQRIKYLPPRAALSRRLLCQRRFCLMIQVRPRVKRHRLNLPTHARAFVLYKCPHESAVIPPWRFVKQMSLSGLPARARANFSMARVGAESRAV